MNIHFLLLLLVVACSASNLGTPTTNVLHGSIITQYHDRARRSPDGFDVGTLPKANLALGNFPDQDRNVKGVKNDKAGLVGMILAFIKQIFEYCGLD